MVSSVLTFFEKRSKIFCMEKFGIDLEKYSDLILKVGLNLQKGEELVISSPVEAVDLVREVTKKAYRYGAKLVTVFYEDEVVARETYLSVDKNLLEQIPEHTKSAKKYIVDKRAVYLGILCDDPEAFEGVDPSKITARQRAVVKACPEYRRSLDNNQTRWCLVAYPHPNWANKVFESQNSMTLLGEKIAQSLWLDKEDYLQRWSNHAESLSRRSKILNEAKIKKFHYKNSLGTDFTIGMPKGYIFSGANEKGTLDGVDFVANMPTQEVFSSPDYKTANGKLVASLPLVRNGVIIKDFYLEFKDGVVVNYKAKEGEQTLKEILEIDEGMKSLGEIALVDYDSPIRQSKVLYLETLFDENASCHFALGKSFSSCYEGGSKMTKEQLKEVGLNDSVSHVDFMVGTEDLTIEAECENGEKMLVFKDGKWAF